MALKDTLNLPDPTFTIPMKADLAIREPEIQAKWQAMGLYERLMEDRSQAPTYLLHDGPPYTNGPIHLGTAFNKILKDFSLKSRSLMGFRTPFVPGYDNHGLPIEQAVMKKFAEKKQTPSVTELRQACRDHANSYIQVQNDQFQRLGIFGMWDRYYSSLEFRYEAEIVRIFGRLIEAGQVYRGLRPVLWSPTSRTALADTEIVYQDHTSKAIYVAFPLKQDTKGVLNGLEGLSAVIWTTTPWTIPANLALAFHPELDYVVARAGDRRFLVLDQLADRTMQAAGLEWEKEATFKGSDLEGILFAHPIYGRDSVAVLADYVTTEDGTGIVHTAPGHGREDFMTGQKYGLEVLCPVNERGVLTEEAGEFAGVYYTDCDRVVVDRLKEVGALLHVSDYHHSYPHAERDGKPVIFRATEQWFISIDANGLRQKMLTEIEKVSWHPASGEKRLAGMISGRPDWCISRQRPWGVGIPIFYGATTGEPVLDPAAIEAVARLTEEKGSDVWYELDAKEILPPGYAHPVTGETEFRKETDVFDVWFDSACTHLCVLEGNVEPRWKEALPADLYSEGSDQHRGWFNVSLVLSTALRGEAPYRAVVTHGFTTDAHGQKMSKRLGNVVDPLEVCQKHGADVLRCWAASVDYETDFPCSEDLLKAAGETYRRIRNTLRFLLGNLYDYDGSRPPASPLDGWIRTKAHEAATEAMGAYTDFKYAKALSAIHNFCVNEVSAVYADAVKDCLYCDGADWETRRSVQAASLDVLQALVKLITPILPHTAEEVYARMPVSGKKESVHLDWLELEEPGEEAASQAAIVDQALRLREQVFAEMEKWRSESGVKDSQDVEIDLLASPADCLALEALGDLAPILFKCAALRAGQGEFQAQFRASSLPKCDRSRLRRPDVAEAVFEGAPVMLTSRDRRALGV